MHKAHILKTNKSTEIKDRWIFFDCETYPKETTDDFDTHVLKLGVAQSYRVSHGEKCLDEIVFKTSSEFYSFIEKHSYSGTSLQVMSLNLPFDFAVSGIAEQMKLNGWSLRKFFFDANVTVVKYKRNKQSVTFIDFFNYIKSSVKDIGELLNYHKLSIDFSTCSESELIEYCRRDVEIVAKMMLRFINFIKDHNLGTLGYTSPSCAFNAYRHRFMSQKIYIHNNKQAMKLEREGYFGGRTECFYIGEYQRKVYHLDVNSMYPFIMKYNKMPVKLVKYDKGNIDIETLKVYLGRYAVIAEVLVDTNENCYPYRFDQKLVFPIGKFQTTLSTPSLKYAVENGHIIDISKYALYEQDYIFADYVDFFYNLKEKYEVEGNNVYRNVAKLFMNSLYGKFAQRKVILKHVGYMESNKIEILNVFDMDGNKLYDEINFLGEIFHLTRTDESSFNSFIAIAAHITDYARMYLWHLIKKAGKHNVLYVDTDSLFVNEKGYRNLVDHVIGNTLGSLRFVNSANSMEIRGLKDYTFGNIEKIKGISKNAKQLSKNVYIQTHFPSFAGILREGITDSVKLRHVTKKLNRIYQKGEVTRSGWVKPYSFHSK